MSAPSRAEWSSRHAELWTSFQRSKPGGAAVVERDAPPQQSPPRTVIAGALQDQPTSTLADKGSVVDAIGCVQECVAAVTEKARSRPETQCSLLLSRLRNVTFLDGAVAEECTKLAVGLEELNGAVEELVSQCNVNAATNRALGVLVGGHDFAEYLAALRFESAEEVSVVLDSLLLENNDKFDDARVQALRSTTAPTSLLARSLKQRKLPVVPGSASDDHYAKRIIDLLGGDADKGGDAATVAVDLAHRRAREMEHLRREASVASVVEHEYDALVQQHMQQLGVYNFPTVSDFRAQLGTQRPNAACIGDTDWLKRRIDDLVQGDPSLALGSAGTNVRQRFDAVVSLWQDKVSRCERELSRMESAASNAVPVLLRLFGLSENTAAASALDAVVAAAHQAEESLQQKCLPAAIQFRNREASSYLTVPECVECCADSLSRVKHAAASLSLPTDELMRTLRVVDTLTREVEAQWEAISPILGIPTDGDASHGDAPAADVLLRRVSAILLHLPQVKDAAAAALAEAQAHVDDAVLQLSQLLVPHGDDVPITLPVETLEDLVHVLRDRFHSLHSLHSRSLVRSSKHEHQRLEQTVRESCIRWVGALRKLLASSDDSPDPAESASVDSPPIDELLATVESLLQTSRLRVQKLGAAVKADRVRIDNYQAAHEGWSKKWQLVTTDAVALGQALGVPLGDAPLDDPRSVLKRCATFVASDEGLSSVAALNLEVKALRDAAKAAAVEEERVSCAFETISDRLTDVGRLMKRVLFGLGCDETATDPVLEDPAAGSGDSLAEILAKLTRWIVRLDQATAELLSDQKKLVRYMNAVFEATCAETCEIHDASLLDMTATLLRLTDGILFKIRSQHEQASPFVSQPAHQVLAHDHRLARVLDTIGKIHSTVESLQNVRYLALPPSQTLHEQPSSPTRDAIGFLEIDPDTSNMTTDDLIRVLEKNAQCVARSLQGFSHSYKHAAILIQKDVDELQDLFCSALRCASEIELEKIPGVDRGEVEATYSTMSERQAKHRVGYFACRPGGEGQSPWVVAARFVDTILAATIETLASRTRSESALDSALRKVAGVIGCEPQSVVDVDAVLAAVRSLSARDVQLRDRATLDDECHRLTEQNQLLTETLTVSDQKLSLAQQQFLKEKQELEEERDAALSEAAVLRASVRRLRSERVGKQETITNPADRQNIGAVGAQRESPPRTKPNTLGSAAPLSLTSVEAYMRNLQQELQARHLHPAATDRQAPSRMPRGSSPLRPDNRPSTLTASPSERRSSSAHRRERSSDFNNASRERSRSSGRSVESIVFELPKGSRKSATLESLPTNRHVSTGHYLAAKSPVRGPASSVVHATGRQHHVVLVAPRTAATVRHQAVAQDVPQAVSTLVDLASTAESAVPVSKKKGTGQPLANLEHEGMQRFVQAITPPTRN